jgi:hypothetical protein
MNENPIYSDWGYRYYSATHETTDVSFDGIRCNVGDTLSYFGMPIVAQDADAIDALVRLAKDHNRPLVIADHIGPRLSTIGVKCLNHGGKPEVSQHAICDLSLDEPTLHRNVRKSFQALINTGRRTMRLEYFNAANPKADLFDSYRRFHAKIAGRVTRPDASWMAMSDMITEGHGELTLGFLDDELVSGMMTFDGTEIAYYASGVYDRSKFDKPLGHFPLYDAILRCRQRGLRVFDLGHLPAKGTVSDKEYQIGYFKRGFATDIEMRLAWRIHP